MISKIGKKIIITNFIIVVISLGIYCFAVTTSMNNHIKTSAKEDLLSENRLYHWIVLNNNSTEPPILYNRLAESITLTYLKVNNGQSYELKLRNIRNNTVLGNSDELITVIKSLIDNDETNVKEVEIDGENYLVTQSTNKTKRNENNPTITVVSLISLESIREISRNNITLLILLTAILVMVSSTIFLLVSWKITKPIKTLSIVADEYSNRNFENSLYINTGDEVEYLSNSVSKMADSLIAYEKKQTAMYRNISHEIKTPLTAIYGYAEGIKDKVFENQDEKLEIIMDESIRIKSLVEDLILLSKLESNVEVFDYEPHSMNKLLNDAIEKIEGIAIMKNIDIYYTPSKDVIINMDRDKMLRAIINVLSNAIKYTNDAIKIELLRTNIAMTVNIIDNGAGFDSKTLNRLFCENTKERVEGSGVGLSIVSEIMKRHNGEVNISNNINNGAKVSLAFRACS